MPERVKCGGPEGEIVVAQGLLLFPARHKHWKCLVQGDLDTENIYITLIHTLETCMLCLSLIWTHKVHTNLDFGNFYATVIKSLKTSMSRWSRHYKNFDCLPDINRGLVLLGICRVNMFSIFLLLYPPSHHPSS